MQLFRILHFVYRVLTFFSIFRLGLVNLRAVLYSHLTHSWRYPPRVLQLLPTFLLTVKLLVKYVKKIRLWKIYQVRIRLTIRVKSIIHLLNHLYFVHCWRKNPRLVLLLLPLVAVELEGIIYLEGILYYDFANWSQSVCAHEGLMDICNNLSSSKSSLEHYLFFVSFVFSSDFLSLPQSSPNVFRCWCSIL